MRTQSLEFSCRETGHLSAAAPRAKAPSQPQSVAGVARPLEKDFTQCKLLLELPSNSLQRRGKMEEARNAHKGSLLASARDSWGC